ncbi:MAG: hypothetical protein R3B09_02920 [Nannocystaceae bacterium]
MRTTPLLAPIALVALVTTSPACVDEDRPGDAAADGDEDADDVDDEGELDDEGEGDDLTRDDLPLVEAPLRLLPAPDGGFRFARTTEERRGYVRIQKSSTWRVVYSIEVEALKASEALAVRGEVQLTTCQASDLGDTPCKRITPFDPKYKAKIVLGDGPGDADGVLLSEVGDVTCSHFKHHCALALDESKTGDLKGTKYVNLVVAATGPAPSTKDRMIVDEGHGGLYVTRIGAGADAKGEAAAMKDVSPSWMSLDTEDVEPRAPHVTFQVKLTGAEAGEIVDVDAKIVAVTEGHGGKPGGCSGARDPLITHQVFLSKHAGDPIGSKLGALTAKNGGNCHLDDQCTYRKSGALALPKGAPGTVYVSVVSTGGRSCSSSQDRWKVGGASEVTVRRRTSK